MDKNKVEWITDFDDAIRKAKDENKNILLGFYDPG